MRPLRDDCKVKVKVFMKQLAQFHRVEAKSCKFLLHILGTQQNFIW